MASLTRDRKFGTFNLDSTNNIVLTSQSDKQLRRTEYRPKLSGDGSLFSRAQGVGRRVTLQGIVYGTDEGERRTNQDALMAALVNGEQDLYIYNDRFLPCKLEKEVTFTPRRGAKGSSANFAATFRSRFEHWRGATVQDIFSITSSPDQKTLTSNPGEAASPLKIELSNDGAAFDDKTIMLTNLSAGKTLVLHGISLSAFQTLTIDFQDGRLGDGSFQTPVVAAVGGEWWKAVAGVANILEVVTNISTPNLGFTSKIFPAYFAE